MLSLFCCGVISFSFFIFLKTSQKEFPGDVSVFTPHHMWACVILPSILEWAGRAPGAPGSSSSPGAGEDLEEKGLSRLPPDLLGIPGAWEPQLSLEGTHRTECLDAGGKIPQEKGFDRAGVGVQSRPTWGAPACSKERFYEQRQCPSLREDQTLPNLLLQQTNDLITVCIFSTQAF